MGTKTAKTTHHDDFRALIAEAFGAAHVVLFGTTPHPHTAEFIAYATDWENLLVFTTDTGQPANWSDGIALVDIGKLDWQPGEITTTNYEDFRTLVREAFGKACVVLYGIKPPPRHNQFIARATNWRHSITFLGNSGEPETFSNNFGNRVQLADIDELKWELRAS